MLFFLNCSQTIMRILTQMRMRNMKYTRVIISCENVEKIGNAVAAMKCHNIYILMNRICLVSYIIFHFESFRT